MKPPFDLNGVPQAAGVFEIPWGGYVRIRALNSSLIKHLDRSPLHLKTAAEEPQKDPSLAMNVGTALDLAIFEPHRFYEKIVPDLDLNKNSNDYKDWKATIAPDRVILTQKHIDDVFKMVKKMKAKVTVNHLLSKGWAQRTVLWKDPEFGFWCKARLDWITPDRIITDLKKAQDASVWGFQRAIWRYKYDWQAWYYLRGLTAATGIPHVRFNWLVWEDVAPYEGNIFEASPSELEKAGERIYPLLRRYADCLESDEWPGYPDQVVFMGEAPMFDSVGMEDLPEDNLPF